MASPIIKKGQALPREWPLQEWTNPTKRIVRRPGVRHTPAPEEAPIDRRILPADAVDYSVRPVVYLEIATERPLEASNEAPSEDGEATHSLTAEGIDARWQERLEEAVAAAREAGIAEGRAEAEQRLAAGYEAEIRGLVSDADRLKQLWVDLVEKSEPILIEMMLDLLEAILGQPAPESFVRLAEDSLLATLESFAREGAVRISLNSIDYLRLQEKGLVAHLNELFPRLVWDPQPELREGDWVAHTPETMVRSIVSESIHNVKDRLGLLAPHGRSARVASSPAGRDEPTAEAS
jgi:flagellar biosynthesis/type III secretory pathway protein FliH